MTKISTTVATVATAVVATVAVAALSCSICSKIKYDTFNPLALFTTKAAVVIEEPKKDGEDESAAVVKGEPKNQQTQQ